MGMLSKALDKFMSGTALCFTQNLQKHNGVVFLSLISPLQQTMDNLIRYNVSTTDGAHSKIRNHPVFT